MFKTDAKVPERLLAARSPHTSLVLVKAVACVLVAGGWVLVETVTCELVVVGRRLVETVSGVLLGLFALLIKGWLLPWA